MHNLKQCNSCICALHKDEYLDGECNECHLNHKCSWCAPDNTWRKEIHEDYLDKTYNQHYIEHTSYIDEDSYYYNE